MINKKCTETQTRNIIKTAATSTDVRKDKIMNLLRQITHNQSPVIRGFGLGIEGEFTKVPARQLGTTRLQNSIAKHRLLIYFIFNFSIIQSIQRRQNLNMPIDEPVYHHEAFGVVKTCNSLCPNLICNTAF